LKALKAWYHFKAFASPLLGFFSTSIVAGVISEEKEAWTIPWPLACAMHGPLIFNIFGLQNQNAFSALDPYRE